MFASNFDESKVCVPLPKENPPFDTDKKCQKSQRMWITAYSIFQGLVPKYNVHTKINRKFCVGQPKKIWKNMMEDADKYTDMIVVWEHSEIIDMLHDIGITIHSWKNKDIYDLVFLLDMSDPKKIDLYYDCFEPSPLVANVSKSQCREIVHTWLDNFDTIPAYYRKNQKNFLMQQNVEYFSVFFKVFAICYVSFFVFCICIYICFFQPVTRVVNNRNDYINL